MLPDNQAKDVEWNLTLIDMAQFARKAKNPITLFVASPISKVISKNSYRNKFKH
jgi:hypothetical protein